MTEPVFLDLRSRPFRRMPAPSASVLCLGNFDGVHTAHTAILREGADSCRRRQGGCLCGVFCFFRPSSDYFVPGTSGRPAVGTHLTTLREKLALFADAGMDFAMLADFDWLRALPAGDFITLLKESAGCVGISCGFNYRFGAGGRGTPAMLTEAFDRPGLCGASILPERRTNGVTVSSSAIRQALSDGDPETAARLLGRPYTLDTRVVPGKRLGRTIGFPTANQYFPAERLVPRHGVYAVWADTIRGRFPGVANVGVRPTVDGPGVRVNCETHLIGLDADLYGTRVRLSFMHFLRPERRFDSLDALTAAITADAQTAAALLRADAEA